VLFNDDKINDDITKRILCCDYVRMMQGIMNNTDEKWENA